MSSLHNGQRVDKWIYVSVNLRPKDRIHCEQYWNATKIKEAYVNLGKRVKIIRSVIFIVNTRIVLYIYTF